MSTGVSDQPSRATVIGARDGALRRTDPSTCASTLPAHGDTFKLHDLLPAA